MKKRGKVLRDTNVGPGLLVAEGKQHQFRLEGMWVSAEPPRVGMTVDVELDDGGEVVAVSAVPESQLAREMVRATLASAREKAQALLSIVAARMPGLIAGVSANAGRLNPGVAKVGVGAVVVLALGTLSMYGCGSEITGTYANPVVTLELKSGGNATFHKMGSAEPCTYAVEGKSIKLECDEADELDQEHDLTILDDGALNSFYGRLEKR